MGEYADDTPAAEAYKYLLFAWCILRYPFWRLSWEQITRFSTDQFPVIFWTSVCMFLPLLTLRFILPVPKRHRKTISIRQERYLSTIAIGCVILLAAIQPYWDSILPLSYLNGDPWHLLQFLLEKLDVLFFMGVAALHIRLLYKSYYPDPKRIHVRLKDGRTGNIDEDKFDPKEMEKL